MQEVERSNLQQESQSKLVKVEKQQIEIMYKYIMGKKNNKGRKIGKQQKTKSGGKNKRQEIEQEYEQMQGQFHHIVQESNRDIQEPAHKVQSSQHQIVYTQSHLNHSFHCLKNEKAYKLVNSHNQDVFMIILKGIFINNGVHLSNKDQLKIKANSSLIIEVFQETNSQKLSLTQFQNIICSSNNEKMTNKDRQEIFSKIETMKDCGFLYQNTSESKEVGTKILECSRPWANFNFDPIMSSNETTLLIGLKNTGKSTLCEYVLNKCLSQLNQRGDKSSPTEICLLDLDVGRNRTYPGSISLTVVKNKKIVKEVSIWVGQYTALNNIQTYLKAIIHLYSLYRRDHFGSALLINTMGYLTGLGELLIYETYDIVKPHTVILMEAFESSPDNINKDLEGIQQHRQIGLIKNNLTKKQFASRLYFGQLRENYNPQQIKSTLQFKTTFINYVNLLAESKATPLRFQYLISPSNYLRSFEDLLDLILKGALKKLLHRKHYEVYQQDKMGSVKYLEWADNCLTDMRVVILGYLNQGGLFEIVGVGFGWKGSIFYDPNCSKLSEEVACAILTDGIDFERNFYLINESKLIWLEQKLGQRICYLAPIIKVLGNRGVRNNPGKRIN